MIEGHLREFVDECISNYDFGDTIKEAAEEAVNDLDLKDSIRDELPDFDDMVSEKVDDYFKTELSLDDMAKEAAESAAPEAAENAVMEFVKSAEFDALLEEKLRKALKRVIMGLFEPEPAKSEPIEIAV